MAKKEMRPSLLPELKKAIRERNLGRLYFFYGEEAFLRNHYLGQIKKVLVDDLTESFNYHKLTKENFDPQIFADAVESLPMMAEYTLVLVDDIDIFKLPEDAREKIADVLSDIPDYCTVIFTYEATEWRPDKRLKKLWGAVESNGMIVEFAKQDQRELINWVGRHFAANKKQISPGLCSYLIEITGGTMTALAGEITKICAFSGADTITRSDIDAVVEPVLDAVVFQMANLLSEGKYESALRKLQQLIKMQQEPIMILGAIGNHFRQLGAARVLLDNRKSAQDLRRLYPKISDYGAQKAMESARSLRHAYCARAMELVVETDYAMKTSRDDQVRLLEMLILHLAQEAHNG